MASASSLQEIIDAMAQKTAKIKVLDGFIWSGKEPTKPGDIIEVPEHFARELIHANKAERVAEKAAPPPAPLAGRIPEIQTQVPSIETQDPVTSARSGKPKT